MATDKTIVDTYGVDPTKVNPYGAAEEDLQNLRNALQENVSALEKRYEKPNWFKIAGAFARPQLGGFMASLGSAADVMGEQVEAQRAQQPEIAKMRAQMGQANILMGQNKKVADMVAQRRAQGLPITPEFVAEIVNLAPESATAKALSAQISTQQKQTELASAQQINAQNAIKMAIERGTNLPDEVYTQAGLKPPAKTEGTAPSAPSQLPNEVLPSQVNQPVPNVPTINVAGTEATPSPKPETSGISPEKQKALDLIKENIQYLDQSMSGQIEGSDNWKRLKKLKDEAVNFHDQMYAAKKQAAAPTAAPEPAAEQKKDEGPVVIGKKQTPFNFLYTPKDVSELRTSSDTKINEVANNRLASIEAVANPKSYQESNQAIDSMISLIKGNEKAAKRVTNPLARHSGLFGGVLSAADKGFGFNIAGLASNFQLPVKEFLIGSLNKEDRNYFDALNSASAKVAQIQQQQLGVNPNSVRTGEIEIMKNAGVNPRTQFPDVMLYQLYYAKLNNQMLHDMYEMANKIQNNEHKKYKLSENTRTPIHDILTSDAMKEIAEEYNAKFKKLDEGFSKRIGPKE
ncbi:hypothetical protein UFOVP239_51 [uncultured Caudovirales phage]|uniref:Uncharacterized protein n=1 Tax=uncultured Caudovirales phage TaxID=2100421 RepID=A0A6J7WTG4_9CAUD|nr:hypothetical protein UFOVP239_51 [uncultured Caudovirales phage]